MMWRSGSGAPLFVDVFSIAVVSVSFVISECKHFQCSGGHESLK